MSHPPGGITSMIWRRSILVAAWLIVVTAIAQFYFVGLAVFGASDFVLHAVTGNILIPVTLIVTIMIACTPLVRRVAWHGLALFGLTLMQPVLAIVPRIEAPAISALHPLIAVAILGLAYRMTRLLAVPHPKAPDT